MECGVSRRGQARCKIGSRRERDVRGVDWIEKGWKEVESDGAGRRGEGNGFQYITPVITRRF